MITFHDVTFSYNQKALLKDFNLTIDRFKTTVLIGSSGCGKSTILRLINGILAPQTGTIKINEKYLDQGNIRNIRLQMGYLIQDGGLFPNMTCFQNITLMAKRLKQSMQEISKRVNELVELTHFDIELLNRYPSEISGGQRQRVSLMRALFLDPDILLLDEPFAALDPLIRNELHKSIKAIFNQLNKTVVIVTHDLNEAAYFSDKVVLLNEGTIIQSDTIENLIKNPTSDFVSMFISAQKSHIENLLQTDPPKPKFN